SGLTRRSSDPRLTVPLTGPPTLVTLKGSPSTSESLVSSELAAITRGVSSAVVAESLTATGASLTALTVTLTVAVAVPPLPSLTGSGEAGGAVVVGGGHASTPRAAPLPL